MSGSHFARGWPGVLAPVSGRLKKYKGQKGVARLFFPGDRLRRARLRGARLGDGRDDGGLGPRTFGDFGMPTITLREAQANLAELVHPSSSALLAHNGDPLPGEAAQGVRA